MGMSFCIYTGTTLADGLINDEHIFPLTLGGHDDFVIKVSKTSNSRVNKELDEKLKSCIFLSKNRKDHQSKGHRKKEINPPRVKARVGLDTSVVLKFDDQNFLQPYSHRRKSFLICSELESSGLTLVVKYERSLRLRFTAKVALAAGFFVYGHDFVDNVEVAELRTLMNYLGECHNRSLFGSLRTTGWFWPEKIKKSDETMHGVFENINEMYGVSFVAFITSVVPDKILIVVGVLGSLTGVLSCPANCDMLPKSGLFDLGHVVVLKKIGVDRVSYRHCLEELTSYLHKKR